MAVPVARPARDLSRVVLLLGLAALVGVVAALLLAASPTPSAPTVGEVQVILPAPVWGMIFLAPLLAGVFGLIFQRATQGRASYGRGVHIAVMILVIALVTLGVLIAFAHPGPQGGITVQQSPPTKGNNSSSPPPPPPPGGGGFAPGAGSATLLTFSSWDLLAAVGVLCSIVLLLTVPGMISRLVDRRPRAPAPAADPVAVQAALGAANRALEQGGDPRETIVALYVQLLSLLEPSAGDVAPLTAREIRSRVLEPLGVRAGSAADLTALFEAARYSSHPLGTDDAVRCRSVIVSVQADLARSAPA